MTDNELIAEFMGFPYLDEEQFRVRHESYPEIDRAGEISDLKYHSSWDWLMPVVEKIEAMERTLVNIYGDATVIAVDTIDGFEVYGKTTHGNKDDKISHVYRAVVDFIKWYNENKKP